MPSARAARATIAIAVALTACRGPEAPTAPLASPSSPPRAAGPPAASDASVVAAAPDDAAIDPTGGAAPRPVGRAVGVPTPRDLASPIDAAPPFPAPAPCTDETATIEGSTAARDALTLTQVAFADLPGWVDDDLAGAVGSFLRSCDKLAGLADSAPVGHDGHGGVARQWRKACRAASKVANAGTAAARAMFEAEFVPYEAAGTAGPTGKLTGYYVAEIRASRTRRGRYQTPVLGRPDDLAMVDLSAFVKDAHGRRIWGRFDRGELVPYYTRAEIRKGALGRRGLELMYADDPVDLLFAQIEGSAKAVMDDGSVVWLEFSGKNGRAYRGVGGILRGGGFLRPGEGTMQGIRQWFRDHPGRFDEIADQDAAYVFFSVSPRPGAVGSQKTILTAQRSIAVDRAFIAMSTPIWVEASAPVPGQKGVTAPWRRLLIAQDTGAGILGAVRGDIYWGDDAEAAELGGRMGGPGRYWLLLPRGVTK